MQYERNKEQHPRALIKAGDTIVISGFPMDGSFVLQYGTPIKSKGLLLLVSAQTGQIISKRELHSPPVFAGMAAANGKLYVSCEDNSIICLK
ncbi:hypothetical protein BVY04_00215 [bacterium M21]|nr:hypothetical protein BVY04_00215 [bacterium M21]